jgi:hypothetical protein
MSSLLPTDHARSRVRWAWIGLLLLLAFAGGLITARYSLPPLPWLRPAQASSTPARAAPVTPAVAPPTATAAVATPVAAAIDPATLATREAAIAAQLAALEARTATMTSDVEAAGGQATRAEATLVAFAARRAIDRGLGLGYLEGQLRARFGAVQPGATELVIAAARQPVTLEDLRQGLDTIAPDLTTGTLGRGWLAGLRHELGGLVILRRSGTPSPLPADRLARARRLIEAGQVEAARAEVARMPGAGDAANWLAAADRYIATRTALDRLEGAALTGQGR